MSFFRKQGIPDPKIRNFSSDFAENLLTKHILAPFLDAHAAGTAFDDPLLPDRQFLSILYVIDGHLQSLRLCEFARIRATLATG